MTWNGEERRSENQYEFGRLTQLVESLAGRFDALEKDVHGMRDQMNRGKGFIMGALLFAGSAGAAITAGIQKLFGNSH